MPSRSRLVRRPGFTLLEMLVGLLITVLIFTLAVQLFRVQTRALGAHAGRMEAQQNARFAVVSVDRDLRVAGVGVVDRQPMIVQADPYAITFNADLVTRDSADPGAVYYDPDADSVTTLVLPRTRQIMLPLSARTYPDSTYLAAAGLPSRAETISYWAEADTSRPGELIMYRRVNDAPARVVAKGIVLATGQPLFRYFKTDTIGATVEIPPAALPIFHTAVIHGSPADSSQSALTDSIRVIRVSVRAAFQDPDRGTVYRSMESVTRLLNAGLLRYSTCGDPPLGTAPTVAATLGPPRAAIISWMPSLDESSGERDVERYALYRRELTDPGFGEPFASVAAGLASYSYADESVTSGTQYVYGVVAQDCTPASSPLTASAVVTIP